MSGRIIAPQPYRQLGKAPAHPARVKIITCASASMLVEMVYCSNCGKELKEEDLFCSKCGARTERGAEEGVAAPLMDAETRDEVDRALHAAARHIDGALRIVRESIREATLGMDEGLESAREGIREGLDTAREGIRDAAWTPTKHCKECGEKNPGDARYCRYCGAELS